MVPQKEFKVNAIKEIISKKMVLNNFILLPVMMTFFTLASWVCWRQIHHRPNFHSTADPPEVPRAPDPNAPPVHRL